uniref:Alpha/beta hydrolase domain-containing protein n=1 Tax=Marinomonas sp. (strain MWYL1) TaxID=400668 RepID=A6W0M1_MARMS
MKLMSFSRKWLGLLFKLILVVSPLTVQAKVVNFTVTNKISPVFGGESFDQVGKYERIDGFVELAVDPNSDRGRKIIDLDQAQVAKDGLVYFSSKVSVLRPIDQEKGNGTILYEVLNRGRNLSMGLLNLSTGVDLPETLEDAGDGFLMKEGYTLVWSGWQTDLPSNKLGLNLDVISSITGLSREEYVFDKEGKTSVANLSYPAADLDVSKASLTVRQRAEDPRSTAPGLSFKYLSPTQIEITRPAGLDNGAIYEFIYTAKEPVPAGLAFISTADVVSFLRGAKGHDVASPLVNIHNTIALGISQSGRYLRDFIYQGFNDDGTGAKVFDGVMAHIAGSRKTYTNYRFAKAGRFSRQHEDHDVQGDQFPFGYTLVTDPLAGQTDGILEQCLLNATCPKIMQTDTSTEFWQARSALVSTAPDGSKMQEAENVRLYFLTGAPHFSGWNAFSKNNKMCQFPTNPISTSPVMRALTLAMQQWTTEGLTPPDSRYPSIEDGSLVALSDLRLPATGNHAYLPNYNVLKVRNYSELLPIAGQAYPVLVPQLDADGIELGGVKMPRVAAPLGTYWGWNLRDEQYAKGDLCGLLGSFIPFASSKGAIEGDSRLSIVERYGNEQGYVNEVESQAKALIADGFMLPSDMDIVIKRAKEDFVSLN